LHQKPFVPGPSPAILGFPRPKIRPPGFDRPPSPTTFIAVSIPPRPGTVTLHKVAELAGVSVSTASRCLSGTAQVSQSAKEHVLEAARKLGYHYNPHVGAVMRLTRQGLTQQHLGTLAYVTPLRKSSEWREAPTLCGYMIAARARAEFYGFNLGEFSLPMRGMSGLRLRDILKARGITGILLSAFPSDPFEIRFPWTDFAIVLVGHTLACPTLDAVISNHTESILLAGQAAASKGCKRIGLAIERYQDEITNHRWSVGFAAFAARIPGIEPIPAFTPEVVREEEWLHWVRSNRVDCVITLSSFRGQQNPMRDWALSAGIQVPRDLSLVTLDATSIHPQWSGIDQISDQIGEAAVDLLLTKLRFGDRGIPEVPRTVLVQGRWNEGSTMRY